MKSVIVVTGATGVGKSDLSIALAQRLGAEIISADSRQFYHEIPIGTAMATKEQLSAVKHHFVGNLSLECDYNSGSFERDALSLTRELHQRMDNILVVGGSGLYIDALCNGFDPLPSSNTALREELTATFQESGLEPLLKRLGELDPLSLSQIDINNSRRVIRALEVSLLAGVPYSSLKGGSGPREFNTIKIVIDRPTEELYERINQRVDQMLEAGLEEEARSVYHLRGYNSLQTVGYREMFAYFDGQITKEEATELIKRNSRRYAKRQRTWLRRDSAYRWFSPTETIEIMEYIASKGATIPKRSI